MVYWLIPPFYYWLAPLFLYSYYCRLREESFVWRQAVLYATFAFCLSFCESLSALSGFIFILLHIFLLAVFGGLVKKEQLAGVFTIAALVISAFSITNGLAQSLIHWLAASLSAEYLYLFQYLDTVRSVLAFLILLLVFKFILKIFAASKKRSDKIDLLALIVPVLFIALVEKTVTNSIYGDTIVINTAQGLLVPVVNNLELVFLHLVAVAGLFAALLVYQKLTISLHNEQTVQLLAQETQAKEIYLQEAQSRYEQTRSFRHDIGNHLLVLRQLLKEGRQEEAVSYLFNLEDVSAALSFPVNTGNTVVDALLGSKLMLARQQGIAVDCQIAIPQTSGVKDIDWCVLLANALDNAIKESGQVAAKERFIYLESERKGNFYFLLLKNACREKTLLPKDGIGLSNIKAVTQKYGGKTE
ncbi:MAG: GHKL domain-containing protein, partial [Sporomusaceae bacterium]|nr:GHKL domain-containing protein [Sporomusaceae bacterium]